MDIEDWNRRELCYTCSQNSKCVTIELLVINKQDIVTLVISKTHIHISSKTSFMYSDFRIFQLHRKCQVLARKPPAISKYSLNCLTLVSLEPFYIDSFWLTLVIERTIWHYLFVKRKLFASFGNCCNCLIFRGIFNNAKNKIIEAEIRILSFYISIIKIG